MNAYFHKLVKNDTRIQSFTGTQQIIKQGLAPLVSRNSNDLEITKANLLEQVKFNNWQKVSSELIQKLNQHNIQFIIFKGFAYTHQLYNNSNIRPYSDIDVFIQIKDYDKTKTVLIKLHYQMYISRQGKFISHQNSFYKKDPTLSIIDLHWQINNRQEFHKHFDFSSIYSRSINLKSNHSNFQTLSPCDAFILTCFHYQAHQKQDRKHIWLYDIALMWNKMDSQLQNKCLSHANKIKQSHVVNSTLKLLLSVFPDCLEIHSFCVTNEEELTQTYIENRLKNNNFQSRIKNTHGSINKILFISEYLFQNTTYVQHRYHLKSKTFVYFYYPKMWLEDILKLWKHNRK